MKPVILLKHEVHCIFGANNNEAFDYFRQECQEGGIKIRDVEYGFPEVSTHISTSSVCHNRYAAQRLMEDIENVAIKTGGYLIRKKIEVVPKLTGDSVVNDEYFNLHVYVLALDLNVVDFDRKKWGVSKITDAPLLKGIPLWVLTTDGYRTTIEQFREDCLKSMESFKDVIDHSVPFFIGKIIYDLHALAPNVG